MIVPDVNLLIFAYREDSPFHAVSRRWWIGLLSGDEAVGLPWAVALAFLRITTDARIFTRPATLVDAVETVSEWLQFPQVRFLGVPDQHWPALRSVLIQAQARGPAIMDGELAALAIAYGATLHTHDRGFARFPGLRCHDPLA